MTRVPSRIDQSASTDHVVVAARVDVAHAERSLIADHATHALLKRYVFIETSKCKKRKLSIVFIVVTMKFNETLGHRQEGGFWRR